MHAMHDEDSEPRTMAWFNNLDLEDRVTLLAEPDAPLPPSLVVKIARGSGPVVTSAYWVANPRDESEWHLAPSVAVELARRRDHLRNWWNKLSAENQVPFVQRRNDRLPDAYRLLVMDGFGVLSTPNEKDSVEFTPIARVFLEWKARELTD
ncbi:hypothetical protein F5X71_34365 [Nocardia brasiliensis]|uniref:Uncharacterized protein n=1 Tax=Nocardia brasiliensis TaxID=37326 RepID=A0A6G9Y0X2_NOCBR|nr:hypothetical protein [Nocardia brasiliensis]QIS06717.1 hypothetical protein F5X71_34365 [Nocardia brasiliensis]